MLHHDTGGNSGTKGLANILNSQGFGQLTLSSHLGGGTDVGGGMLLFAQLCCYCSHQKTFKQMFCFQAVSFHDNDLVCFTSCSDCTLDQMMTWNHTVIFSQGKTQAVVALPGTVGEFVVQTMANNSFMLEIKYFRDKIEDTSILYSKNEELPPSLKKSAVIKDVLMGKLISGFVRRLQNTTDETGKLGKLVQESLRFGLAEQFMSHTHIFYPTIKGYNRVNWKSIGKRWYLHTHS